jgi:Protein of unknown function (DUF1326)
LSYTERKLWQYYRPWWAKCSCCTSYTWQYVERTKWKAAFYLDKKATPEQSEALGKIFSGQAGGFFAALTNLIGCYWIWYWWSRRWLRVNNLLELEIGAIIGGDNNQESRIVNPAFSAVPGSDLVVARSTKHAYNDHGIQWDSSGKNGFYCRFTYKPWVIITLNQKHFSHFLGGKIGSILVHIALHTKPNMFWNLVNSTHQL